MRKMLAGHDTVAEGHHQMVLTWIYWANGLGSHSQGCGTSCWMDGASTVSYAIILLNDDNDDNDVVGDGYEFRQKFENAQGILYRGNDVFPS